MSNSQNLGKTSAERIREARKLSPELEEISQGILSGDQTALARGITWIESTLLRDRDKSQLLIEKCLGKGKNSKRIGVTGVPGVGKSTFIEALGMALANQGHKVAVLAIDPSSARSRGSILGDKTRMENLGKHPNAFIRPSAAGESLGGVARKTRESIVLCEAAGFDIILIETVGVGQSETTVYEMVDFFLLLKLAGAGDELQGIKRGIVELADAIVIHKADGANLPRAEEAKALFERSLHVLSPAREAWKPKVLQASSLENRGIEEIWLMIQSFFQQMSKVDAIQNSRAAQNLHWMDQHLKSELMQRFMEDPKIAVLRDKFESEVRSGELSPFRAVDELLKAYLS